MCIRDRLNGLGPDADLGDPASDGETPVGSVVTDLKRGGLCQRHDAGVAARGPGRGECQVAPAGAVSVGRDKNLVAGTAVAEQELAARHRGEPRVCAGHVVDIEPGSDQRLSSVSYTHLTLP